jgi:hypothetical protein
VHLALGYLAADGFAAAAHVDEDPFQAKRANRRVVTFAS